MKKFLSTFIIMLFYSTVIAQIEILNNSNDLHAQTDTELKYDSLWNSPKNMQDCKSLIGHKITVCPKPKDLRAMGYKGFLTTNFKIYSQYKNFDFSIYDSLAGREFRIINTLNGCLLTLSDNRDTLFYQWISPDNNRQYPFITNGYIEKMNQVIKGREYVYIGEGRIETDPISGDEIKLSPRVHFIAEKIVVLESGTPELAICALVRLKNGTHSAIPIASLSDISIYLPSQIHADLNNKYGAYWVNLAIDKKIKVGMPAKLVEMAWGKPRNINRSSHGPDQWCYERQYVYIRNGKVVAWN